MAHVTDTQADGFTAKAAPDNLEVYKKRVAEPVMAAIDSMPAAYRALVREFDYVGVYRAWSRGWSIERIRMAATMKTDMFR